MFLFFSFFYFSVLYLASPVRGSGICESNNCIFLIIMCQVRVSSPSYSVESWAIVKNWFFSFYRNPLSCAWGYLLKNRLLDLHLGLAQSYTSYSAKECFNFLYVWLFWGFLEDRPAWLHNNSSARSKRLMCYVFLTQHNEEVRQCCPRGARTKTFSIWCLFIMVFLKVLDVLLSRHPLCSCPVGRFCTTLIYFLVYNSNVQRYGISMNCFINLKISVIYLPPLMFFVLEKLVIVPKALTEIGKTYTTSFW